MRLIMLIMLIVMAGARPAAAQLLSLRLYDEDSGLSTANVGSMAQDRAGLLYAASENGLYRYDGFRFSRIGPHDGLPTGGHVESVTAATDGGVWVVFADRAYLYGSGATVSVALEPRVDDERAQRAAVLGHDLLLVRNHRLLRIRRDADRALSVRPAFTGVPSAAVPAGFDSVHVEHDVIWLGCGTAMCRLHPDGGVSLLDTKAGLPADRWVALLRDHDGTLWLRSAGRIASMPRGAAGFSVIDVPGGRGRSAGDPGRLALVEDAAGHVVTQSAKGLLVREDGHWMPLEREENMFFARITTMLVDREGSMWIGSTNRGIARVIGLGMFDSWTRAQGLSDDLIWNARRDGAGTLWVATDLAIDALSPDARVRPDDLAATWHYPFRAFALARSAQGRLWIGSQEGSLISRDPRTGQSRNVARLAPIRVIAGDPAGRLWIGTSHGLAWIDRPDDTAMPTISGTVPGMGRVFAITFDHAGDVWVLTEKTLFHRDVRQQWHPVMQTDPEGGYQTRSMSFAADGTLWLGSFTTGVIRLHLDHDTVVGRDRQPSEHLASQQIEMMQRDPAGRIWIGTDHGLDVTDSSRWRHLDDQDGLISNDIDENAMFIDDDGTPWFGTAGGLSHLIDTSGLFDAGGRTGGASLHPIVTRISVGGRELSSAQIQQGPIHLPWSSDPMVFAFASLDFKFEKSIRFRYRLRGLDPGWVETTAHEVRYPEPPWGKLTFEVMAVDPLHRLRSEPVGVIVKMLSPWWRTWPVYVLAAACALGFLALLWRLRIGYLLRRQRQLEALVVERTREIEQARLILLKQSTLDALTGLLNRPAILERLRLAIQVAVRDGTPLGVALLDLDHFKKVNDVLGHLGGDAVLVEVGRRLSTSTRDSDQAGRYGGEELLLVLPGLKRDAFERVEALRSAVFTDPVLFEDSTIRISCSMGVTWMQPGDDVTSMIRRADAGLYIAKAEGRDRVVFQPPG